MTGRRQRLFEIVSIYDLISGKVYRPRYFDFLEVIVDAVAAVWFAVIALICVIAPVGLTLFAIWLLGGFR